ncbi:hypothetical protein [Gaoshiqia sediminis]|uniref:Uncharacterized protein n=1 Tax=Gaoshiqia sediminis TaxID=2986998 RepID=A0AA41Y5T7_9BACT|nr:hypothetical protein [Gaoshiqia sediminis]MCW0483951.1 hypothetical protein [Gaoshiqia sediminis]
MKKRDYYMLGLLACLVVFAAFNRKTEKTQASPVELATPRMSSETKAAPPDSIQLVKEKVIKAGV